MVELAVAAAAPADNSDLTPFMMATSADPGGAARRLRTRVHGMSADEVIAAGATVAADKARRGATRPH
jgi:hypothetical protein